MSTNIFSGLYYLEGRREMDDISLAKNGDKEAFCRLLKDNQDTIYRVAISILSENDCADAVQEAVINAYKNISKLKDNSLFKTWLVKIVINESNRIYKKRKMFISLEQTEEYADSSDFEDGISVRHEVMRLEQDLRMVIMLYYYEDMSIKDIAIILNIPEGTVKSRLSRAREKLEYALRDKEVI